MEVAHEALFKAWPTLDQWLNEEQAFLIDLERIRSAHQVWSQAPAEQKSHALLGGLLLTRARDWMMRYPQRFLGRDLQPLREFVAMSAAAEDAERARAAAQEARTRRMERLLFRGALAAVVVLAILAAGAGFAAWIAVKNEARAARNFELTVDQADALVGKISTELKDRIGISQDVIRRMLALLEGQIDALARIDERSPRLAVSRTNMLGAFVDNYIDLGDIEKARQRARECVDVARPLQRAERESFDALHALAGCLERLADALSARSAFNDAIKAYEESIALRRRLLAGEPGNTTLQFELAHVLTYASFALMVAGKVEQAHAGATESFTITRRLTDIDAANARWSREYIDSLNVLAMVLQAKGQFADAIARYREAIEVGHKLVEGDRGNATLQRFLSNILANLSDVLWDVSRHDQALTALDRSVLMKRRLHLADGENAIWEYELAAALTKLGRTQFALEKWDQSFAAWDEAHSHYKSLLRRDPDNALRRWSLAECLFSMAVIKHNTRDAKAAHVHAREGLDLLEEFTADDPTEEFAVRIVSMKGRLREFVASLPAP